MGGQGQDLLYQVGVGLGPLQGIPLGIKDLLHDSAIGKESLDGLRREQAQHIELFHELLRKWICCSCRG